MAEGVTAAGAPAEVYRRYLTEGKLGFQQCQGCRSAVFYPRVLCPVCGSTSLTWEESGGRGTVYATTAVYHRDREPVAVFVPVAETGEG